MGEWPKDKDELSGRSHTACTTQVNTFKLRLTLKLYYFNIQNCSHLTQKMATWWTLDSTVIHGFETNARKIICFNLTEGSCVIDNKFNVRKITSRVRVSTRIKIGSQKIAPDNGFDFLSHYWCLLGAFERVWSPCRRSRIFANAIEWFFNFMGRRLLL